MKNKLKILCLYSVIFLLNQTSPLHAVDHKEEIHQKHSQLSPSLDSERSHLIKRIYKHKEELERTKTYITLSVAHTCLSFYWASDDLIYRSMYAVLGAANTIGPWLPSKIQGPFNTVLWGIGWLLEAGRLGSSPKRYVCESVLGYSTLLLMDFAMHSDASGCYQKELNALIYYASKLAGWYGDDLFLNSCEFFRKNLVWGQEKKPWCSPLGEELCSHSDSHIDSDSDPMLPIIYSITNGWKAVPVCNQGNETQNNLCKMNYFKKLPNYAYIPNEIETLYKSIKFLGKGAENKVYKVELNHTYYNTTHIALRAFVKSMYGLRKNDIPPYLATRALIKASSTDSLNIDDFFPKIFSVYFSSLPDDVKNIKLYEGTDINASLIPTGLYDNHFFKGVETGFLPEGVDVRYIPVDQKHMGWEMPILPVLYTEMELVDGGSLASLSKIPDEAIAETYFMEYALSIKDFHNSDHRLENVGLKSVPYLRAYHKDEEIYLMTSESMPQILDWDWVVNRKDKTQSHLFQHVSEKDIKKQVSGTAMEFMHYITWNGLFSSKTQKFLKQYLVTEKDIKNQKLKGRKIKHYVIT